MPINSVISASDYKISDSNYIITTTDYKITDTDYRIGRHLRKNYSGQKRVFLSIEIKNCYCWIWCGCPIIQTEYNSYLCRHENIQTGGMAAYYKERS